MEISELELVLEQATRISMESEKIETDVDQLYNVGLYFRRFVTEEGQINLPLLKFFVNKTGYKRLAASDQVVILVCAIKVQLKIGEYKGFEYNVIARHLDIDPAEVSSFIYRVVDICNGSIY